MSLDSTLNLQLFILLDDNRPSSVVMYRARANCLKLNDRNRHQGGEVGCKLCGANIENLEHFLLEGEKLGEERRRIVELQQPYEENIKKIMGIVLFKEEGIEKKKSIICGEKEKRN